MALEKTSISDFEAESQDLHLQAQVRSVRRINAARAGTTLLALCMGLATVGVSANSIAVYNNTHVSSSADELAWLSMWPSSGAFDFRPTVALVAGASVIVLCNIVALASHHRLVRYRLAAFHAPLTFVAPLIGLIAAIVAMTFFYAVNSSTSVDTLLSWSCRWRDLSMKEGPRYNTLCRTSHTGVYLAILLIPVEAVAFGLAGWQCKIERFALAYAHARKSPSPVLA